MPPFYNDLKFYTKSIFNNLSKHGTPFWWDNYKLSKEYKAQNARYKDYAEWLGLSSMPTNWGDSTVIFGEPIKYCANVEKPIINYGKYGVDTIFPVNRFFSDDFISVSC